MFLTTGGRTKGDYSVTAVPDCINCRGDIADIDGRRPTRISRECSRLQGACESVPSNNEYAVNGSIVIMKKSIILLFILALCFGIATAEDADSLGQPFRDFTVTDPYTGRDDLSAPEAVDRFGGAALVHSGSFTGAPEAIRAISPFPGKSHAETAVMTENSPDISTRAFPVAQTRAIFVDNENIRPVAFRVKDDPTPQPAFVVYDDTAQVRFQITASDYPAAMACWDMGASAVISLPDLLDAESDTYVYDLAMPTERDGEHFAFICLVGAEDSDDEDLIGIYLIPGDEYIEELAETMRAWGYDVTWSYEDSGWKESALPQAYILHMVDQEGAPVPGVYVNFCTDSACSMAVSDSSGKITFEGAPDIYHVQLLKVPEGYSFDTGFDMYTESAYGEWVLRIRKQ